MQLSGKSNVVDLFVTPKSIQKTHRLDYPFLIEQVADNLLNGAQIALAVTDLYRIAHDMREN